MTWEDEFRSKYLFWDLVVTILGTAYIMAYCLGIAGIGLHFSWYYIQSGFGMILIGRPATEYLITYSHIIGDVWKMIFNAQ